ncbi:MAG: hypothetical protein H0T15_02300 [Thermoleophilaceae bacterium]|nr:hypothetical protein [Thermoleophilaceae bacterium]
MEFLFAASPSPTQIALVSAGTVAYIAYVVFILAPAWGSYGRLWERMAAGFLSLYILAAVIGIGVLAGVLVVVSYDRFFE